MLKCWDSFVQEILKGSEGMIECNILCKRIAFCSHVILILHIDVV